LSTVTLKEVRYNQPVLHRFDDPNYRSDNPDEISLGGHTDTYAQAIRQAVLVILAPDVAGAGGFPSVNRDPNHRRHCSPAGLKRLRRQYDAIVKRADAELSADDGFVHDEQFGWMLTASAHDALEEIIDEVEIEANRNRGHGISL
jgi:hypothetical protein